MPRYMRAVATNATDPEREQPGDDAEQRAPEPRGDQQRKAAVHGDRSSGMPGRVAGVDRQALEAVHARPVRVHDKRRRAIGRRLDGEREYEERREPPLAEERRRERDDARDDR